jgi:DNA polymerase III alpha subunit (gram-positive type)
MKLCAFLFLLASPVALTQEFAWPDENPDAWLLAFVDVETTGLIPGHHEMIDIGIVMTDLAGFELGELFVRIQPEHPERTDEGARAVNAFDADRWRELQALSQHAAIEKILTFRNEIAGDKNVLMVAFNSHFDTAFLDHLFRSQDRSWRELYHYFVLDLPSMAWSLGIHGLTGSNISGKLGIEDEPHIAELHTGITGARLNARIYRAWLVLAEQE